MNRSVYYRLLGELVGEDRAACRQRESAALEQLTAPFGGSIVIFGAGRLGKKLVAVLQSVGRAPVAFADNNEHLWGRHIDGIPVYGPAEAASRYGANAVFVVAIFSAEASGRYEHRAAELKALGCQSVIPFVPVLWLSPSELPHWAAELPSRVLEQKDEILRCGELWADDASRAEYLAQLRWRLFGDFEGLPPASNHPQYFPDFLQLEDHEVLVDCGAYDGDSLRAFLRVCNGRLRAAACFEPDPGNFGKLRTYVEQLPPVIRERITLHQAAVSDAPGELRFMSTGDTAARIGPGDLMVSSLALDDVLATAPAPTYIKMDIEGAELAALSGARGMLAKYAPALAICAYHTPAHLWQIPLLIHQIRPDYQFFLRPYAEVWELVCYAIPPAGRGGIDEQ